MKQMNNNTFKMVEIIDMLNELYEKSEQQSKYILQLEEDLLYYKTKCRSLEEGLFRQDRDISKLKRALMNTCEVEICEICKHSDYFFCDYGCMGYEYDMTCEKGLKDDNMKYDGVDVQECEEFKLDLGVFLNDY